MKVVGWGGVGGGGGSNELLLSFSWCRSGGCTDKKQVEIHSAYFSMSASCPYKYLLNAC